MWIARHGLHPPGRVNFMRDGAESGKQEIRKVGHARRARPRFVRGTSTDYAELIQLCSVRQKNLCNLRWPRRSPSGAEAGNLWTGPLAQIKAGGIWNADCELRIAERGKGAEARGNRVREGEVAFTRSPRRPLPRRSEIRNQMSGLQRKSRQAFARMRFHS